MRAPLFKTIPALLLCLSIAALAGSQTPSTGSGDQPKAPAAAQAAQPEQTITIVGCLVQETASGERRPEAATTANDYFVRTPTVALPVGTTVTVGKPGTTSTTTSAGTPTADSFYRVLGLDREQLHPHVGHRVELQGHLSANKPDASKGTEATTTVDKSGRPTTTVETRVDVAGELHATAIKMVSASCK
jgi:hypothetical protein